MPHRRLRWDERILLAILLLELGVIAPLFSALSEPPVAPAASGEVLSPRLAAPVGGQAPPIQPAARRAIAAGRQAAAEQQVVAPSTPVATQPLPPPEALPAAPTTMPEAAPAPTLTNTPEPLPAVPGPADGAPQPPPQDVAQPDAPAGGPPPILMYHYIRYVDQGSDPLGYELSVAPELFEAHMAWLHEQGYTTMRMDAAAHCIRGDTPCPGRAVALTFDDGYEDAFTTALPVLQRYGFTATFYIISGLVGQPGYMNWEQLGVLRDSGMEIGAHTIDHYDLTSLDPGESERQIAQSRTDLEHGLGISIVSFCYPTGLYNGSIEEQTRAAGYLSATTTRWDGDYSDMMALPRRRIAGGTSVDGFAATVMGY